MTKVLGIEIFEGKTAIFSEFVSSALAGGKQTKIAKVNTEFLSRAMDDKDFLQTLSAFDLNIADGRGVLWVARYLSLPVTTNTFFRTFQTIWQMIYSGAAIVLNPRYITYPITESIPGLDALRLMLRAATDTSSGVFVFGATQSDLDGAINNIQRDMPELKISGSLNGYDFQDDKSVDPADIINKTDAKLLIVALGSPLQEFWIRDNLVKLKNVRVAVGEGGSLAFLAGTFKRAPKWVNSIGLEWLWRVFMNRSLTHQTGSRLKRVWNAVPVFICKVVKWKLDDKSV